MTTLGPISSVIFFASAGVGPSAFGDTDAELAQNVFSLILVNFHGSIPLYVRLPDMQRTMFSTQMGSLQLFVRAGEPLLSGLVSIRLASYEVMPTNLSGTVSFLLDRGRPHTYR